MNENDINTDVSNPSIIRAKRSSNSRTIALTRYGAGALLAVASLTGCETKTSDGEPQVKKEATTVLEADTTTTLEKVQIFPAPTILDGPLVVDRPSDEVDRRTVDPSTKQAIIDEPLIVERDVVEE